VSDWRALATERRFAEAAELLRPKLSGNVGMGHYAAEGYRLEALGDEAPDDEGKRKLWEAALESYLLYSLVPARGDTAEWGWQLAEELLIKLEGGARQADITVVDVTCPFCGAADQITVDPSGGQTQTFVEDCSNCCHPRTVHVEPDREHGIHVWVERG
jgi:hypothetical protein